jgi:aryl-alcohol dehydrogenase-like predicted oxidoreductase
MPRFESGKFAANLGLLDPFERIARRETCTPAQLALAWVLARGEHVLAIPGTTSIEHLKENCGADRVRIDPASIAELDALFEPDAGLGNRYNPATQAEIDTETFDWERA